MSFVVWSEFIRQPLRDSMEAHDPTRAIDLLATLFGTRFLENKDCALRAQRLTTANRPNRPPCWYIRVECPAGASAETKEKLFSALKTISNDDPEPVLTKATVISAGLLATTLEANTTYVYGTSPFGEEGWVPFELGEAPTLRDAVEMFILPDDDVRFSSSDPGLHRGVRAKIDIPKYEFVCSYSAGGVITTSRLDDTRDLGKANGEVGRLSMTYTCTCRLLPPTLMPGGVSVAIYGNPLGSGLGPLVNDCRGTNRRKNCTIALILRTGSTPRMPVTIEAKVMTVSRISQGQELLTEYGDSYWEIMND